MAYRNYKTESLQEMLIQSMQDLEQQGLVDSYFRQCHALKKDGGRMFFVELIQVFLTDAHTVMQEMMVTLDQLEVDFEDMYCKCIKLKGSSACFGACRISNACCDLRDAIKRESRPRCVKALKNVDNECNALYNKLSNIMMIEQEIVSRET